MAATDAKLRVKRVWIASAGPSVDDDSVAEPRREVGDDWVDESVGETYTCWNSSAGAAQWVQTDGSGGGGGGGGDSITIDGSGVTDADFDDATPAAPAGSLNVKWQKDASSPANVSAYVTTDNTSLEIDSAAIRRAALTGDVTAPAGSNATTIAANAVTNSKFRQSVANSVVGRASGSTGNVGDIQATVTWSFLGFNGTSLSFLLVDHANLANNVWTSSGHTGTANRYAGFDGSGNAAYFTAAQIVDDILTAKGQILTFTSVPAAKSVSGSRGAVLTENADQTDGLEWVSAPSLFYGDGFDGNVTIAAGTTTLTAPKDYGNLTVNGTLVTDGYSVQVRGTLTFGASGVIHNNGTNAVGTARGTGGNGNQFGAGGDGAAGAAAGGAGRSGASTSAVTNSWAAIRGPASGGKGGNGGQGNGGGSHPGGTGGTPSAPTASRSAVTLETYDTGNSIGGAAAIALAGGNGGAEGGGDNTGATTGAGGGGGGVCIVKAWIVDATAGGSITANGGNGSAGTIAGAALAAGGGGGGGGGAAGLVYGHAVSGTLPTISASGGNGGAGAGTGATGGNGTGGYAFNFRMPA